METLVIRGKSIGKTELAQIKQTTEQHWDKGRMFISRELCELWDWRQYNGVVKNLASHLLGLSARTISRDWQEFYGHPVYLLEAFVERDRFAGTCYKAANWQCVGATKGHAKKNNKFYYHGQIEDVYLYPLVSSFRNRLGGVQ